MGKKRRPYTTARKKRLVEKISMVRRKKDLVAIYDIIKQNENVTMTYKKDGVLMLFTKYKDETYELIDKFLRKLNKTRKYFEDSETNMSMEYVPYSKEKNRSNYGPKYSNREKSIINRRNYDRDISKDRDSNVIIQNFDIQTLSETPEKLSE